MNAKPSHESVRFVRNPLAMMDESKKRLHKEKAKYNGAESFMQFIPQLNRPVSVEQSERPKGHTSLCT